MQTQPVYISPYNFTYVIGMQGVGKTSTTMKKLKDEATRVRVLNVLFDDQEEAFHDPTIKTIDLNSNADCLAFLKAKNGMFKVEWQKDKTFSRLLQLVNLKPMPLKHFILNMDDANAFFMPKPEDALAAILKRRRQYKVNIYASAHGFKQVPVTAFDYLSHYLLFATAGNGLHARKENVHDYEGLKQCVDLVNSKYQQGFKHTKIYIDKFGKPVK